MSNPIVEKMQAVTDIMAEARAKAAPLLAEIEPYMEALSRLQALGLDENATPVQIAEAFANSVDINPVVKAAIPTLLTKQSAQEIRDAAKGMIEDAQLIGSAVGSIFGRALSLL